MNNHIEKINEAINNGELPRLRFSVLIPCSVPYMSAYYLVRDSKGEIDVYEGFPSFDYYEFATLEEAESARDYFVKNAEKFDLADCAKKEDAYVIAIEEESGENYSVDLYESEFLKTLKI